MQQDIIAENFRAVRHSIARACREAGRSAEDVTLVAVTKTQAEEAVEAALAAGQRVFGENRVQEAVARWETRRARFADLQLRLIGPLQSNKVDEAVALFDVIETIDRPKLATHVAKAMKEQGRPVTCLIQVNTGEEEQKAGVLPRDLPGLLAFCRDEAGLEIAGLMCIPPVEEPAAVHFALLAKLARRHGLAQLSMGMSGDYEKAVALGATSVRVGTALFGERGPVG